MSDFQPQFLPFFLPHSTTIIHKRCAKWKVFLFAFPHHQIITTTINYDQFVIYEFSLRGNCSWQWKNANEKKPEHKVRGRLIVVYWRRLVFNVLHFLPFAVSMLGKEREMIYERTRWRKNFRFSFLTFGTLVAMLWFHAIKNYAHPKTWKRVSLDEE